MSWLVWRQHRSQLAAAGALLAAFALAVAVTGEHMAHSYADAVRGCTAGAPCLLSHLFDGYGVIIDTVHLTILLPVVLGAFVAAPLIAREVDQGTHALVWTQSVTRRRWLAGKVGVVVAGSLVLSGAVSALVTWWSRTTNALDGDRFHGAQFDTQNLVPVDFTLFAVALGLAAGAALRRTLPAVVATVFAYVAVRLAVGVYVRPHYLAPVTRVSGSLSDPRVPSGSWIVTSRLLDPRGRVLTGRVAVPARCDGRAGAGDLSRCLDRLGYHTVTTFHPPGHYWPFQLAESALFCALAAGLIVVAAARTLRRDA